MVGHYLNLLFKLIRLSEHFSQICLPFFLEFLHAFNIFFLAISIEYTIKQGY